MFVSTGCVFVSTGCVFVSTGFDVDGEKNDENNDDKSPPLTFRFLVRPIYTTRRKILVPPLLKK